MARTPKTPRSTRRSFGRLRTFRSGRWKASYTGPDGRFYEAPKTFAAKVDAEAWLTDRRREIDAKLWNANAAAPPEQSHLRRLCDRVACRASGGGPRDQGPDPRALSGHP